MKRLRRWLLGPSLEETLAEVTERLEGRSIEVNGVKYAIWDREATRDLLGL